MDKWTDNIRKQAGDYKRKAPEGLLDDIKKEMARRGYVVPPVQPSKEEKKQNLSLVWGRRIAIAAAAAIAALIIIKNIPTENNIIADRNKTERGGGKQPSNGNNSLTSTQSEGTEPSGIAATIENFVSNISDEGSKAIAMITGDDSNIITNDGMTTEEGMIADNSLAAIPPSGSQDELNGSKQMKKGAPMNDKRHQEWYTNSYNGETVRSHGGSGFGLAVNYGGMSGTSNGPSEYNISMLNADTEGNPLFVSLPKAESNTETHAHHDMPVKIGVGLRYNINSRWSVQTGVNYSYLSSDITRTNNLEESTSKQKLHYVSVPLTASYSVWHNKNFNVYVSGGGEAAKLVKGKASVSRTVYGKPTTNGNEKINEHRLQYSVNAAAGVEYKPTGSVSIYAEPGVAHYFDNHSSVVNIYKDKPTQFTINVGLRININR